MSSDDNKYKFVSNPLLSKKVQEEAALEYLASILAEAYFDRPEDKQKYPSP